MLQYYNHVKEIFTIFLFFPYFLKQKSVFHPFDRKKGGTKAAFLLLFIYNSDYFNARLNAVSRFSSETITMM